MDVYKREVERKFIIQGMSYELAYGYLSFLFDPSVKTTTSFDLYWPAPRVDFVRLRENSQEITVKVTDKGSILDRIEENVQVEDMGAAQRLLTLLYGNPISLTKKFSVFDTVVRPAPGTNFPAILCLYQVEGDPLGRVFFEVEAESLAVVDYVLDTLTGRLDLKAEIRSLYQIFSKGDK